MPLGLNLISASTLCKSDRPRRAPRRGDGCRLASARRIDWHDAARARSRALLERHIRARLGARWMRRPIDARCGAAPLRIAQHEPTASRQTFSGTAPGMSMAAMRQHGATPDSGPTSAHRCVNRRLRPATGDGVLDRCELLAGRFVGRFRLHRGRPIIGAGTSTAVVPPRLAPRLGRRY